MKNGVKTRRLNKKDKRGHAKRKHKQAQEGWAIKKARLKAKREKEDAELQG